MTKKKWVRKKKHKIAKVAKNLPNGVHAFKRRCTMAPKFITSTPAILDEYFGYSESFSIDKLPNYLEFTHLFDEYRITGIKYYLIFQGNTNFVYETYFAAMPIELQYVIDYDDVVAPPNTVTGWTELQEHANCKLKQVSNQSRSVFSFTFSPRVQEMVYNTPTTTSYGTGQKGRWLDCDSPSTPHYGLKYILHIPKVNVGGAAFQVRVDAYADYFMEFKGVR